MNINDLLAKHKAWLDGLNDGVKANLRYADLHYADFRGADLHYADLRDADFRGADLYDADLHYADLRDADLYGVNLDFAVFPLWCGGLDVHIDDRIATQLLYHLVRNVLYSKNTSPQLKGLLSKSDIVEQANKFHRVDECGEIVFEE